MQLRIGFRVAGHDLADLLPQRRSCAGRFVARDRKILARRLPEYPDWAEEKGISAVVQIFFTVRPDGSIRTNMRVDKSSGYPELDQLAKEALLKWRFSATHAASERRSDGAGAGLSTTTVMLNGLYEFSGDGWHMKPYVGAGFGMIDVNERVLGANGTDWTTAYQVRGGVTMGLTQKLLGSFEYRWTMGSKPHFSLAGIPTKLEVDRHGFVLGFNYKY